MKKHFLLVSTLLLSTALFSFTSPLGGDVFRIYLNGRQVHQQFLHAGNSAETFTLPLLQRNDRIAVSYSHCGKTGRGRTLSFRNEKAEVIKTLTYADASGHTSMMAFSRKDLPPGSRNLQLYYAAKELPQGYRIATISRSQPKAVAKTALL